MLGLSTRARLLVEHTRHKFFSTFGNILQRRIILYHLRRVGLNSVEDVDENQEHGDEESHPAGDHLKYRKLITIQLEILRRAKMLTQPSLRKIVIIDKCNGFFPS